MMYCCIECPNLPTCADIAEAAFARPEDVTDEPTHD